MSVQAMAWALQQQQVTVPRLRHVLLCLANYADEQGRGAWPSVKRITQDTGMSRSSVLRAFRELEDAGLISPGDQRLVELYVERRDRRPLVWNLAVERGVSLTPRRGVTQTPREPTGCQPDTARGVTVTPKPSIEPSIEDPPYPPAWGPPPQGVDPEAWWDWTSYKRGNPAKATITKLGNLLARYPVAVQRAAVDRSIANGWAGLFPDREAPSGGPRRVRVTEVMDRLRGEP